MTYAPPETRAAHFRFSDGSTNYRWALFSFPKTENYAIRFHITRTPQPYCVLLSSVVHRFSRFFGTKNL